MQMTSTSFDSSRRPFRESASDPRTAGMRAGHGLAVDRLRESGRLMRYAGQQPLYLEGDTIDAIHVIETGIVKLIQHLANGRSRVVRLHAGGTVIGLNGLLQPTYSHTAVALGDVTVRRLPLRQVGNWCNEDPRFCVELFEHLYDDLREADIWITQFSTGDIRGRVARLLSFLMSLDDVYAQRSVVVLPSCADMANILGVTPESVSRNVAAFKRDQLLRPLEPGTHKYLCDSKGLQRIGLA